MNIKKLIATLLFTIFWISHFSSTAAAQLGGSYVTAPASAPRVAPNPPKPYAITLGIQYPTGLVLEFNHRPSRQFSFAVEAGGYFLNDVLLNSSVLQGGVKNSLIITAFEGRARWHPSGNPFFAGLAVGWQVLWMSGLNGDAGASGTLSGLYFTPHLGWLWALENGFTFGTEFGVQVPLGNRNVGTFGLTATNMANAAQSLTPMAAILFPYINFIKVGYSF